MVLKTPPRSLKRDDRLLAKMSEQNDTHLFWQTRPPPAYEDDRYSVVMTIGVPLVVTFLILLSLCMVFVYTKARRRANASNRDNPVEAISAHVPLSTSAFQNFIRHIPSRHDQMLNDRVVSNSAQDLRIMMTPPSYEDAMKESNATCTNQFSNASFSASCDNIDVSSTISPPPYEPPQVEQDHNTDSIESNRIEPQNDKQHINHSGANETVSGVSNDS